MNKSLTILLLVLLPALGLSQDCLEKLEVAQRAYYNGNLSTVLLTLEDCISDESLSSSDREAGLRLLINSSLILNKDSLSNNYMQRLLALNPLIEVRPSDLVEFKRLYESYWIRPKMNIKFVLGLNRPLFSTLQYRGVGSITEESDQYDTQPGASIGVTIDRYLSKNMFISSGLSYNGYSYKTSELLLTYQQSFIEERLDYLTIPAQIGWEFPAEKTDIFLSGGVAVNLLLSSKADLELLGIQGTDRITIVPGIPEKGEGIDLREQRKSIVYNYQFNVGIRHRIGLIGLELIAQYDLGLNNLVDPNGRFANENLWGQFSYVPDDFKMDAFKLLFGVSRRFSTPEKRK